MARSKFLAGVLGVAAAFFTIGGVCGAYTLEDPVEYWKTRLGVDFAYVNEVTVRSVGPLHWTRCSKFTVDPSWDLEGETDGEQFSSLIEGMRRYVYDGTQSDPSRMDELKLGNCQAMTLYAKALLDEAGLENRIVLEKTHMYNQVQVEGEIYNVDFAKGKLITGVSADES